MKKLLKFKLNKTCDLLHQKGKKIIFLLIPILWIREVDFGILKCIK
jgi:hypothetical protein